MAKQTSRDNTLRQKRLRRRKVILFLWGLLKSFFVWLKETITFKKTIVVFCIWYVVRFVEYLKLQNESGIYFSETIAVTVITAFLVELGLTALASIKGKDDKEINDGDDINYG